MLMQCILKNSLERKFAHIGLLFPSLQSGMSDL
jgi:hypothetical protein